MGFLIFLGVAVYLALGHWFVWIMCKVCDEDKGIFFIALIMHIVSFILLLIGMVLNSVNESGQVAYIIERSAIMTSLYPLVGVIYGIVGWIKRLVNSGRVRLPATLQLGVKCAWSVVLAAVTSTIVDLIL